MVSTTPLPFTSSPIPSSCSSRGQTPAGPEPAAVAATPRERRVARPPLLPFSTARAYVVLLRNRRQRRRQRRRPPLRFPACLSSFLFSSPTFLSISILASALFCAPEWKRSVLLFLWLLLLLPMIFVRFVEMAGPCPFRVREERNEENETLGRGVAVSLKFSRPGEKLPRGGQLRTLYCVGRLVLLR